MAPVEEVDVCVIGAGLAGAALGVALARQGLRVRLVEARAAAPREFRAEKMGEAEMAAFARLGLEAEVRAVATPIDEIWIARYGRKPWRVARREYGFAYADLVAAIRRRAGTMAQMTIGRVASLETGPRSQTVTLADGTVITARLIVIATGLGEAVRRLAGIVPTVVSAAHSLSFGFDMAAPAGAFRFGSLVAYGERFGDRSAYLTLFPIGDTMRGNLFTYRSTGEEWTRAFRSDPTAGLARLVPGICRWHKDMQVRSVVEMRPVDLLAAGEVRRPGLVLIGDAFMTCCPVPGVGIPKVLTDIERLCHHLPGWMATPGMEADKIARFYDDPVKRERDGRSMEASVYARGLATQEGPVWAARRLRNAAVRHGVMTLRQAAAGLGVG